RDRRYLEGVERWFASRADVAAVADAAGAAAGSAGMANAADSAATDGNDSGDAAPCPPMFTPFRLRGLTIPNRVVVSPMDMYCAENGTPNDFHLVHLGSRALGGAGLIITEMTCVSPEGRITPGCTGMYAPEHVEAWRRI